MPSVKKGEGIGLKNIRNRLQLSYQRQDLLVTEANNNIFKATLKLPIQNKKDHEQHYNRNY